MELANINYFYYNCQHKNILKKSNLWPWSVLHCQTLAHKPNTGKKIHSHTTSVSPSIGRPQNKKFFTPPPRLSIKTKYIGCVFYFWFGRNSPCVGRQAFFFFIAHNDFLIMIGKEEIVDVIMTFQERNWCQCCQTKKKKYEVVYWFGLRLRLFILHIWVECIF